jgi:hydroxymethylbilane synthase
VREGDAILGWDLHAQVVAPDGEQVVAVTVEAAKGVGASTMGLDCAEQLRARGAMELLGEAARGLR